MQGDRQGRAQEFATAFAKSDIKAKGDAQVCVHMHHGTANPSPNPGTAPVCPTHFTDRGPGSRTGAQTGAGPGRKYDILCVHAMQGGDNLRQCPTALTLISCPPCLRATGTHSQVAVLLKQHMQMGGWLGMFRLGTDPGPTPGPAPGPAPVPHLPRLRFLCHICTTPAAVVSLFLRWLPQHHALYKAPASLRSA